MYTFISILFRVEQTRNGFSASKPRNMDIPVKQIYKKKYDFDIFYMQTKLTDEQRNSLASKNSMNPNKWKNRNNNFGCRRGRVNDMSRTYRRADQLVYASKQLLCTMPLKQESEPRSVTSTHYGKTYRRSTLTIDRYAM